MGGAGQHAALGRQGGVRTRLHLGEVDASGLERRAGGVRHARGVLDAIGVLDPRNTVVDLEQGRGPSTEIIPSEGDGDTRMRARADTGTCAGLASVGVDGQARKRTWIRSDWAVRKYIIVSESLTYPVTKYLTLMRTLVSGITTFPEGSFR